MMLTGVVAEQGAWMCRWQEAVGLHNQHQKKDTSSPTAVVIGSVMISCTVLNAMESRDAATVA